MLHPWWRGPKQPQTGKRRRRKQSFQPQLESLESRQVLAPLMVTTTADSGTGSLRQAITTADGMTTQATIDFEIGTGVQTIMPATPLPALTDPAGIILDGTTETGYSGTPLVVINGQLATGDANGLVISGGNSTIKGLTIDKFPTSAAGISVDSSNNTIESNYIGTDAAGTVAAGNYFGIYLPAGATNNTIGGTTAALGNVISGNTQFGVLLEGSGTSGNLIEGNFIGTNAAGTAAVPNGFDGVFIEAGATANTIGGTATNADNVISGNTRFGIYLLGSGTTGNVVYRNVIGLNAATTAKLPNGVDGIAVLGGASGNQIGSTIGGTTTAAAPLIAGNADFGILVGANDTVIQNSLIGTNQSNATGLGNGLDGIVVDGAAANTIGDTVSGEGNLISGNDRFGIFLDGSGASGNVVEGNGVGVALGGSATLANTFDGVALFGGASGNTIGGTVANAGNVLSGNARFGVYLNGSGTSGNVIEGNFIGLSRLGTVRANAFDGVALLSGPADNTIGGSVAAASNVISANGRFGILLGVSGTSGNVIQGNFIGTDATGTIAMGNTVSGMAVETGAAANTVGGTIAAERNVISGNVADGVDIGVSGTSGNLLEGNYIGINATGTAALANGTGTNGGDGVTIFGGATNNTIGGTVGISVNLISGNDGPGVMIENTGTSGNVVTGNFIGTNALGTGALGNTGDGVVIAGGASQNTVGGTATGAGDLLSGDGQSGVDITGTGTSANVIMGSLVGTNDLGTSAVPNGANGITIEDGAANNTIGGTAVGATNVISGNSANGIEFNGSVASTTGNLVQGNSIGTEIGGTVALANGANGVLMSVDVANNTIGGTVAAAANTIAFNTAGGVVVGSSTTDTTSVGDAILGNSIFANGGANGLGINLGDQAAAAAQSLVAGPNDFQNHPVFMAGTTLTGTTASATVTFTSLPSSTFRLEFFLNNPGDTGQGRTFLGAVTVTTNAAGNVVSATSLSSGITGVTFNTAASTVTLNLTVPTGTTATSTLTATATATVVGSGTGVAGDTSEFSTAAPL